MGSRDWSETDKNLDYSYGSIRLLFWVLISCAAWYLYYPNSPLWQWLLAGYVTNNLTDTTVKKGGGLWPAAQRLGFWRGVCEYLGAKVNVESVLDPQEQFIFASFPHGAYTIQHMLTMTDGCGFLSKVYPHPRRDLVASVLFQIPLLRELVLWLGCVDASAATAKYNLRLGRSILIFVGGEKEQLLTTNGEHRIYLKKRKGFIKLAITNKIKVVPMYAFGEESAYRVLSAPWLRKIQSFLQHTFALGIPVAWGRFGTLIPFNHKPIVIEMGKPVDFPKSCSQPTTDTDKLQAQIDEYHAEVMKAMVQLFDRTKARNGEGHASLIIE